MVIFLLWLNIQHDPRLVKTIELIEPKLYMNDHLQSLFFCWSQIQDGRLGRKAEDLI